MSEKRDGQDRIKIPKRPTGRLARRDEIRSALARITEEAVVPLVPGVTGHDTIRGKPERMEMLARLRFMGHTIPEMAEAMGVTRQSVARALKSEWFARVYEPTKQKLMNRLDDLIVDTLQEIALEVVRGKITAYREARRGRNPRWASLANTIGNELYEMYRHAAERKGGGVLSDELKAVFEKTIRKNAQGEVVGTTERVRVAAPSDPTRIGAWSAQSAPGGPPARTEPDAGEEDRGERLAEDASLVGEDGGDGGGGGGVAESAPADAGDAPEPGGEDAEGDLVGRFGAVE